MSRRSVQQKVERGVALLDRHRPGWESTIDTHGSEWAGAQSTGPAAYRAFQTDLYRAFGISVSRDEARDHGFLCRTPFGYPRTERAWQDIICSRRAAGAGPARSPGDEVTAATAHEVAVDALESYLRGLDLTV